MTSRRSSRGRVAARAASRANVTDDRGAMQSVIFALQLPDGDLLIQWAASVADTGRFSEMGTLLALTPARHRDWHALDQRLAAHSVPGGGFHRYHSTPEVLAEVAAMRHQFAQVGG